MSVPDQPKPSFIRQRIAFFAARQKAAETAVDRVEKRIVSMLGNDATGAWRKLRLVRCAEFTAAYYAHKALRASKRVERLTRRAVLVERHASTMTPDAPERTSRHAE